MHPSQQFGQESAQPEQSQSPDAQTDKQQQAPQSTPIGETQTELQQWTAATEVLRKMLESSGGIVSSRALSKELRKRGIVEPAEAREAIVKLKLFNFEEPPPDIPTPEFRYYHRGRSFYSEEAHARAEADTDRAAEEAEEEVTETEEVYEEIQRAPRRREEARLVKYVEEALESIYGSSEYGPDEKVAYDVHNERPGSEYENVDVIAVDWRSDDVVELVTVEVKLEFSPKVVQQAHNYCRFSHRVWIAVPVSTDNAALELREQDVLLFEYFVERGIGILACRRRQGGAYEIWPIHWPRLNQLDAVCLDRFIFQHRNVFEEACVVERREEQWRPRFA